MLTIRDLRMPAYAPYRQTPAKSMLVIHRHCVERTPDHVMDGYDILAQYDGTGAEHSHIDGSGRCPYHFLLRANGLIDHLLPIFFVAPHARLWDRISIAMAVTGDFRTRRPTGQQWHTLVQFAGVMTAVGFAVWGHDELEDSSRDAGHCCPGQYLPMDALRDEAAQVALDLSADDAAGVLAESQIMGLIGQG